MRIALHGPIGCGKPAAAGATAAARGRVAVMRATADTAPHIIAAADARHRRSGLACPA